jgi:alanine dehydrogenase
VSVLYLTEADVQQLLPMRDCIGLMQTAFERLASGEAINQPRRRLHLLTRSTMHYMAASDGPNFGIKVYSTNPKYGARFLFLLYRSEDAALLAVLEANHLGQIRTGAASGLATSLLANPDAHTLGIIGSGFQARSELEAVACVRPLDQVKIWSRSAEKRAAFAAEMSKKLGIKVEAATSAEDAVRGSEILITATNSKDPVLDASWVPAGAHINVMGSNDRQRREAPPELIERADLLVVDSREQARMEAGDLVLALTDEGWSRTVELQDVAAGRFGRKRPQEITLFKSVGLAVEDVISAACVYERALASGAGRPAFGGVIGGS